MCWVLEIVTLAIAKRNTCEKQSLLISVYPLRCAIWTLEMIWRHGIHKCYIFSIHSRQVYRSADRRKLNEIVHNAVHRLVNVLHILSYIKLLRTIIDRLGAPLGFAGTGMWVSSVTLCLYLRRDVLSRCCCSVPVGLARTAHTPPGRRSGRKNSDRVLC